MDKLVSVIIPVFDMEPDMIKRCVKSIKMQTYQNWEIIIIDDGSCPKMAMSYDTLREKNIYIIHQKNKGVSASRNKGIKLAKGEFITFADADDYLAPSAIQRGMQLIEKENADMVIGAVEKIDKKDANIKNTINPDRYIILKNEYDELKDMCLNAVPEKYLKINGNGEIIRGPFARLIRAHIAKADPFPEGIALGEDVIWNLRMLKKCENICIDFNIWYYYVINADSAIHKYYGNRKDLAMDYLKILLKENPEIRDHHKDALIKNMAIEFYCILNYDWMSPECSMTYTEKIKSAKELLVSSDWELLRKNYLLSPIPVVHKFFITLVIWKIWPLPLEMYNKLKKWSEILRKRKLDNDNEKSYCLRHKN